MTMREKMARAIHHLDHQDSTPAWDDLEDYMRGHYLNQADAALDVLMEPSDEMEKAVHGDKFSSGHYKRIFTAMIRAAKDGK